MSSGPEPAPALPALTARIREILRSPGFGRESRTVSTGWEAVDRVLGGGLARGAVHEWFGIGEAFTHPRERWAGGPWTPPLYLAIHLAWQAVEDSAEHRDGGSVDTGRVLWIGREIWPYPRALVRDFGVRAGGTPDELPGLGPVNSAARHVEELELVHWPPTGGEEHTGARTVDPRRLIERSLLVDAHPVEKRLWAIDLALRCGSLAAVVADGSRFDMAATRRLQLAAEAGRGLGLLLRPPWEASGLSAATTRWRVLRSLPRSGVARPCWRLELSRTKGQSVFGDALT